MVVKGSQQHSYSTPGRPSNINWHKSIKTYKLFCVYTEIINEPHVQGCPSILPNFLKRQKKQEETTTWFNVLLLMQFWGELCMGPPVQFTSEASLGLQNVSWFNPEQFVPIFSLICVICYLQTKNMFNWKTKITVISCCYFSTGIHEM